MEDRGVFAHFFRNRDEFEKRRAAEETALGKFEAEQKYRRERAAEIGLKHFSELPFWNPGASAKGLYPEIDEGTRDKLKAIIKNNCIDSPIVWWPQLTANKDGTGGRYRGFIPTAVLEEASLADRCGFFKEAHVISDRPDNNSLLYGRDASGQRYLVAFWGEKAIYEKVKAALEPEPKAEASGSRNSDLATVYFLICLAVTAIVLIVAGLAIRYADPKDKAKTKDAAASASRCILGRPSNIKQVSSVYQMPEGAVTDKRLYPCLEHDQHTLVWVYGTGTGQFVAVPEDVGGQLKVGDAVPLKRPEY